MIFLELAEHLLVEEIYPTNVIVSTERRQRFTGIQCASLFIITSTTVVRGGLGTSLRLDAMNVSSYSVILKIFIVNNYSTSARWI